MLEKWLYGFNFIYAPSVTPNDDSYNSRFVCVRGVSIVR